MDCALRDTNPHECTRTWKCPHNQVFTRHKADGHLLYGSDHCAECHDECAADQAKLDRVAEKLGQILS